MKKAVLLCLALSASSQADSLKTVTFNAAGLPYVRPRWARTLKEFSCDIAALQAVRSENDAREISRDSGLAYYARIDGSLLAGGGLAILSRFPILQTKQISFRSAAGLGALMARIETPSGELDVYDTHWAAGPPSDPYRMNRQAQLLELFEMIRTVSAGKPFILLGDLNAGPGDPEYSQLRDLLGLEDPCVKAGRDACKKDGRILVPGGRAKARPAFIASGHEALEEEIDFDMSALRARPKAPAQIAVLRELRARFEAMAASLSARTRLRRWIPVYGFFHALRYDRAFFKFELLSARADGILIKDFKDCAQR